jgi:hypothetical protein
VRRVLFFPTEQYFREALEQVLADESQLLAMGNVDSIQHKKFLKFMGWKGGVQVGPPMFKHGLWHRTKDGISTCSNHCERFHRSVNARVTDRMTVLEKFRVIHQEICKRHASFGKVGRRQAQKELSQMVKDLQNGKVTRNDTCHHPMCLAWREIKKARFGVDDFPCPHSALSEDFSAYLKKALPALYVDPASSPPAVAKPPRCWNAKEKGLPTFCDGKQDPTLDHEQEAAELAKLMTAQITEFAGQLAREIVNVRRMNRHPVPDSCVLASHLMIVLVKRYQKDWLSVQEKSMFTAQWLNWAEVDGGIPPGELPPFKLDT